MCLLGVVVVQSLYSTEVEYLVRALALISPHVEDMFALLSYQMPTRKKCHCKPKMCMRERKTARVNHGKWQARFVESCPEIVLKHTADLAEQNECVLDKLWQKEGQICRDIRQSFNIILVYLSNVSVQSLRLSEILFEDKLNQKCNFCHLLLTVMLFQIHVIDFGSILEESFACFLYNETISINL